MSFHAWLKTLFLNRHRSWQRQRRPLPVDMGSQILVEEADGQLEDAEYARYLIRQAFRLIECEFSQLHQKAFRAYALDERMPEDVAQELGISSGTVYCIKSKILSRLRQELRQLLD